MDEQKFWDEADNTLILLIEYDSDKLVELDIPLIVDIPFNMDDSDYVGILDLSDLSCERYEPVHNPHIERYEDETYGVGQDWHNDPNTHNYV